MTTVTVNAGGDVQKTLDDAKSSGSAVEIHLERGATFTGNFVLPYREGTSRVTLRTAGELPEPSGVPWITPEQAQPYARLKAQDTQYPVLSCQDGAHDYTVDGIAFAPNVNNPERTHVELGRAEQTEWWQVPQRITMDRCYLSGDPNVGGRRGIGLHTGDSRITRCYMEKFFFGDEAQCIASWAGPGPFWIEGNYLEGAGENFITGGATANIPGLIPSDLTFRLNKCFKPLDWKHLPNHLCKNLFELKVIQRALIEFNIFENCWVGGQDGHAIQLTVRNQDGNNPQNTVSDVTIRYNSIGYCEGFAFNLLGIDDTHPSVQGTNLTIHDNVIWSCQSGIQTSRPFLPTVIYHNTWLWAMWRNLAFGGESKYPDGTFTFRDNAVGSTESGITGDDAGLGLDALNKYAPGHIFHTNVIEQPPNIPYPEGQLFTPKPSIASDGYWDYNTSQLVGPYPMGSDGRLVGCDMAKMRQTMPWAGL